MLSAFPCARVIVAVALLLAVAGCESWLGGASKKPLEGERIDVLRGGNSIAVDERIKDLKILLPKPDANEDWPRQAVIPIMRCTILPLPARLRGNGVQTSGKVRTTRPSCWPSR